MGDLLGSYSRYAQVKSKCTEKTCIGLWASLQSSWVVTNDPMGQSVTTNMSNNILIQLII